MRRRCALESYMTRTRADMRERIVLRQRELRGRSPHLQAEPRAGRGVRRSPYCRRPAPVPPADDGTDPSQAIWGALRDPYGAKTQGGEGTANWARALYPRPATTATRASQRARVPRLLGTPRAASGKFPMRSLLPWTTRGAGVRASRIWLSVFSPEVEAELERARARVTLVRGNRRESTGCWLLAERRGALELFLRSDWGRDGTARPRRGWAGVTGEAVGWGSGIASC